MHLMEFDWWSCRKMRTLKVLGGNPLSGTIEAAGAKNAMTKLIVASLLSDKKCVFFNVPDIGDVAITLEMCREVGMEYFWDKDAKILEVETKELKTTYVPQRFSGSNRIPILMIGALLARSEGDIVVPMVGGDAIGSRPVDLHINSLRLLGATVEVKSSRKESAFHAFAPNGLKGAEIVLQYPSVGATENTILAAATARGTTIIRNAAIEPEVVELILFLQKLGAHISIDVDRTVTIQGTRLFHNVQHTVMTDRVEAASYAMLGLATGGRVFIKNAQHHHMVTFLNAIREIGASFSVKKDGIEFWKEGSMKGGIHLETDVHPGFLTDWQQPFVVLLTQCEGSSIVHETVYENRLGYVETLKKMGANVALFRQCLGSRTCRFNNHAHPHSVVIKGGAELFGQSISIPDLRAGFAYVMASLVAKNESSIYGYEFLERGYDNIIHKLQSLGACVELKAPEAPSAKNKTFDLFETLREISHDNKAFR